MAFKATSVTRLTESRIVEFEEIASRVAIAASIHEISDSRCRSDLRSVKASQLSPLSMACTGSLLWVPSRHCP